MRWDRVKVGLRLGLHFQYEFQYEVPTNSCANISGKPTGQGRQKLILWSGSDLQPANHPPTDIQSFWFFIFALCVFHVFSCVFHDFSCVFVFSCVFMCFYESEKVRNHRPWRPANHRPHPTRTTKSTFAGPRILDGWFLLKV